MLLFSFIILLIITLQAAKEEKDEEEEEKKVSKPARGGVLKSIGDMGAVMTNMVLGTSGMTKQFILNVRLDYRITGLLSIFKREFDESQDKSTSEDSVNIEDKGIKDDCTEIDLDGQGGRTFLRVLLHLTMHDYPPLVSGALLLLFRHFSQRQEVLQAFKQVQLLVSASDVENYKQIKSDLDELRLLVEKSELWVFKSKHEETSKKKKDLGPAANEGSAIDLDIGPPVDPVQNKNYKTIQQILLRLTRLCVQEMATGKKPRKHEQRLLRNMGAHAVILELLQIPYDKVICYPLKEDIRMNELMRLAHEFLQHFALIIMQIRLYCITLEAQTMRSIFMDNVALCNELNDRVVQHFVHCIETHGRHVQYLKFLQTIVKAEGQYIRKGQDIVMQEMVNASEDVLVFYNDKTSFNHLVEMMRSERQRMDEAGPLQYHINLVKLLACCTEGKNVFTEIKCHSLLSLDDIVQVVTHPDCLPEVKEAYINFLSHCFIDTEVEMKEIYTSNHIWTLFENFLVDMAMVCNATHDRRHADIQLENYVTNSVMNIITTFFNSPFSDQSTTVQAQTLDV
ncbi:inositol 1,4,5-trisphosphate receptor type 1 [Caerostris extrusa]|uniref:Inositol 1,4,5-trisphosphate receptor type 1 n=1 Tax=Caerostris extrusa TaxID=172846 RepID=A0AAV4TKE7_CAEEX|nr:inositol 1,4,5-trisphosphate receptor type 1 [Caerostris extrusa]